MSFETEVMTRLRADTTLAAILTGGIYAASILGDIGITDTRTTPDVWTGGQLRPSAVVKERTIVTTGDVLDYDAQLESARQFVEVWLYDRPAAGYGVLDSAGARIRTLLLGATLSDSFELHLAQWLKRERDPSLPGGALLQRMDWQVDFIMD